MIDLSDNGINIIAAGNYKDRPGCEIEFKDGISSEIGRVFLIK
jgi:hypothetical protein